MKHREKCKISISVLLFIVTVIMFLLSGKEAEAAEKRLSSITAVYTGESVLIGDSIEMDKLTVMGLYSDGSYVKLKNYSLSTYVVGNVGNNIIKVSCEGVTGTFVVEGKRVTQISAYYADSRVTVGEQLDREKITVKVYYSDGGIEEVKEYTLSHTTVSYVGLNEYIVTYEGKTTKLLITGAEEKKPKSFYVSYNGPAVIVGNTPKREHFFVSVFYNDNTTERITSFELTPAVIEKEGSNTVVVSVGELSAEVKITGLAKTVTSITAEYKGFPVVIGKTVASEDIIVTATFNDGTKDTVTNFTLSSSVIYKIGDNLLTVFCGGKTAYINVRGVEAEIINYNNGVQAVLRDGGQVTRIKLAVNGKADAKQVSINEVDTKLVKKAMRRLIQSDEYMAFEVVLEDPDMDKFLPMTIKLSVPEGYDKDNFGVFYTPNRKTIMAQMNGEFLQDGYYEFKMFQPGTYIVADCTPLIYVETLALEEKNLSLRVGRSYSLDPEVLPHTATNKEVTYTSSRPQIVSVSKHGTLKALKTGTAIITVETTDGSGISCTLRVSVVEKKGKFDAEIAELSGMLDEVGDARDFINFLDYMAEDMELMSWELSKQEFLEYEKEIEAWMDTWDEETIKLDEEEWLDVLYLLYQTGEYTYSEVLFDAMSEFEKEINEIEKRLMAIESADDYAEFMDYFMEELQEKEEELEEEELLLYLMAMLQWAEEAEEELGYESWDNAQKRQYNNWIKEMREYL